MENIYDKLSKERKKLQELGEIPEWYTTAGWQLFKSKYLVDSIGVKGQFERISRTAAKHLNSVGLEDIAYNKFFELMWNGWLCLSTPVLANTGTKRGLPVSCSANYIDDSIDGFYTARREVAILTKHGFGTASYLNDIRPRGSKISTGGKALGTIPVIKGFVQDMREVSQGNNRRGSWAGYIDIEHDDFEELSNLILTEPDDLNIGWIIRNSFISKLDNGDEEALRRYQKVMKVKMVTGKGYFFFHDKVQEKRPQMYKDLNLDVKTSQLCNEIMLFNDINHTYTCILSSMNVAKFDEWKNTDAVFWSTIFLDCIAEEFIDLAKNISGLEKAVLFTKKGRALGLGQCGFHTLLQSKRFPFESFDAHLLNVEIAKHINDESLRASQYLAEILGEPEWCKSYGVRNTHRCVSGDTNILTKYGNVKISTVVNQNVDIWNGKEWTNVTPFKTSSNEQLYEITLSTGDVIECTFDHEWLIKNNRANKAKIKLTNTLLVGDKLEKWVYPIIEGNMDLKYAYAGGFFTGDGSYNQSNVKYKNCKKRKEIRIYAEDKKKCISKIPIKDGCDIRVQKDGSLRFYIDDNVPEKWFVPTIQYTVYSRLQWLAGLFDSDGSKCGSITSAKKEFLLEVKHMAISCGLFCTVREVKRIGGFGSNLYYRLDFSISQLNVYKQYGFECQRINFVDKKTSKQQYVYIKSISLGKISDTYCLTDPKNGTAIFNNIMTRQCAIAPTKSNALLSGGVSEGINPDPAFTYTQTTSAGEVDRVSPVLLEIMKERNVYNKKHIKEITEKQGSVQHVTWLSDEEKKVFKTAFEIDQKVVLRLASTRAKYLDQWQSLNLFFSADESPQYISEIHKQAFHDQNILGLYYIYTQAGVTGAKESECEACQ